MAFEKLEIIQWAWCIILVICGAVFTVARMTGTIDSFSFLGGMLAIVAFFFIIRDDELERRICKLEEDNKKESDKTQ